MLRPLDPSWRFLAGSRHQGAPAPGPPDSRAPSSHSRLKSVRAGPEAGAVADLAEMTRGVGHRCRSHTTTTTPSIGEGTRGAVSHLPGLTPLRRSVRASQHRTFQLHTVPSIGEGTRSAAPHLPGLTTRRRPVRVLEAEQLANRSPKRTQADEKVPGQLPRNFAPVTGRKSIDCACHARSFLVSRSVAIMGQESHTISWQCHEMSLMIF